MDYFWLVISQPPNKFRKTCSTLSCVQLQYLVAMYMYLVEHLSSKLKNIFSDKPLHCDIAKYIIEELGDNGCRIYYDNPFTPFNNKLFTLWQRKIKRGRNTKDDILYQAIDNYRDKVYHYMH